MRLPTFWKNLLLFGPPLLLWSWMLLLAARHGASPTLHAPAMQAIPSGSLLLVTADLRAPRGPALRALLGGDGLPGGEERRSLCGADPLDAAAEVALGMPAAAGDGAFGVAVAGPLREGALVRCAERVIQARGGRPVVLREGTFSVVTDVASTGEGVVAVREGGPLLFGGVPYVRRMMAAAAGQEPSVAVDARHVALRAEAGEGALVASALLSADLRERLQEGLREERSPLARVLGLGLSVGAADPAPLRLVVGCDGAPTCAEVGALLLRLRGERGASLAAWLPGGKAALDGAEVRPEGPTVQVRAALSAALLSAAGAGLRSSLGGP